MSEAQAADAGVAEGPSAGTLLRRAREAAGLHVAALAVSLKVPVAKLEALEADRFDLLPDAVFTRALASSVCRVLKIDAQPILDRLPRSGTPRLVHDREGINAPFRAPGEGPRPGWAEQLTRPVALTVGGLLLAALVLVVLPTTRIGEAPVAQPKNEPVLPPGAPTTAATAPVDTITVAAGAAVPPAAAASQDRKAEAPPVAASAPAAVAVAAASPGPEAQPAPVVPAAAATAAVSGTAPATPGVVVFRTRGPSWVEVVDAKGQTVLRRLMEGGEAASASGPLPLTVIVGSVGATEVQVRGRPFDLGPVSRDNVARFEVK